GEQRIVVDVAQVEAHALGDPRASLALAARLPGADDPLGCPAHRVVHAQPDLLDAVLADIPAQVGGEWGRDYFRDRLEPQDPGPLGDRLARGLGGQSLAADRRFVGVQHLLGGAFAAHPAILQPQAAFGDPAQQLVVVRGDHADAGVLEHGVHARDDLLLEAGIAGT